MLCSAGQVPRQLLRDRSHVVGAPGRSWAERVGASGTGGTSAPLHQPWDSPLLRRLVLPKDTCPWGRGDRELRCRPYCAFTLLHHHASPPSVPHPAKGSQGAAHKDTRRQLCPCRLPAATPSKGSPPGPAQPGTEGTAGWDKPASKGSRMYHCSAATKRRVTHWYHSIIVIRWNVVNCTVLCRSHLIPHNGITR